MSDTLVKVDHVSKKFCRTLRRSLWYGVRDLGSELVGRYGHHNNLRRDEFWAVRDINFELKRGETIGLIGHNGAGKTTSLRMLNGLIKPDSGAIEVHGRMQALIALGAGFNPVLSGRENVYINAAVLGIPKAEVDRRFDEIIDFAGIEEFIDTPVQSYSSGMRVRLGFAVAAHMDPDVLLVDEVLAVGDLPFQAKCRQRILDLMQDGVGVILVSHNLHTISYICTRSVVLEKGQIIFDGTTPAAIDVYRASLIKRYGEKSRRAGSGEMKISNFEILNEFDMPQQEFGVGETVKLRIHCQAQQPIENPVVNVAIYNQEGIQVTGIRTDADDVQLGIITDEQHIDLIIPHFNLLPNVYDLTVSLFQAEGYSFYDRIESASRLFVRGGHNVNGTTFLPHTWQMAPLATNVALPLPEKSS